MVNKDRFEIKKLRDVIFCMIKQENKYILILIINRLKKIEKNYLGIKDDL